ncbi:hypothetical protein DEI89_13175 [Curtobacterium sp. MCBD17_030]|nr:hypothetical protein DEI89_13175 [Curtobacterium sp. MCBD17_030]
MTLVRNPDIMFGREKVGGIEVSHLSHIDKPLTVALTATRGKRKNFTVHPLPDVAPVQQRDWLADLAPIAGNPVAIRELGRTAQAAGADGATIAAIRAALTEAETNHEPQ